MPVRAAVVTGDMSASASVLYRLSLPHPERHLCEVELCIRNAGALGDTVDLAMAAWSPGSYLIRDYSRFVRNVRAFDRAGAPRAVRKQRKDLWAVSRDGADELVVRYEVYGHDLTVRTNHIDESHAFLHGPATYLYVEALRDRACRVEVAAPAGRGWHVATGLAAHEDEEALPAEAPRAPDAAVSGSSVGVQGFVAADLDELMDSPIHLGPGPVRSFTAAGTPVRLALWGELDGSAADADTLMRDLAEIIDTHAARLDGTLPFAGYTFILMLAPDKYGGLEHRSSSANLHTPLAANSRKSYEGLLELLSHEFFHVWNGKRLYPEAHCPFDYSREAYTRCLWVMEGLTSYYDRYTVLRAGRQTARRYLEKLAEEWGRLLGTPGRKVHSIEEASFDAWIKLYKPDEFNVNSTVSYYLKGGLVALTLDLLVRRHSGGARGLDDVLRLLWSEYGQAGRPYPEDVQALFEKAAGMALGGFFDACVRGCEDPDLADALAGVGLSLREIHDPELLADGRKAVWLGVMMQGGSARVARVLDGTPASEAGLSPGDEIIAIDGLRVQSEADLRQRLPSRSPGDRVSVALFRLGRLTTVDVILGEAPPSRVEIASMAEPTDAQREAFAAWLGEAHPGAGLSVTANAQQWC